ncbi:hypothetical protein EF405_00690 [Cyclobacteriaceae bacterium YHN15]|nr:hypothetical protein EF405_00690 [Cyclobacteriaceae bacterium YHN15]
MKILVIISWITVISIYLPGDMTQQDLITQYSLQKEKGDPSGIANSASNLGIFYEKSGQYEMAIQRFKEALSYHEQAKDTSGIANMHGQLALLYMKEDKLGMAEFHLENQVKLDSLTGNQKGLGFYFDQMGVLKNKQGFQEEAYSYFIKGLIIRENLDDGYELGESITHIAYLLFELRQYREAIDYAYRLLEIAEESQSLRQKETAYAMLSQSYEAIRWFQAALDNQKNLKTISDSLVNQEVAGLKIQHKSQLELLEHSHRLALAELENLPKEEIIAPNNGPIYVLIASLALLICLLILAYYLRSKNLELVHDLSISKEEKRILLKETQESMEESLQLISGLLVLQDKDKVAGNGFGEGYGRAKTIALIGKSLNQKHGLPRVNVKGYLLKLCLGLYKTYHVKEERVKLILDMGNINLDPITMVPLALIVHELVANSLKYAFPGGQKGEIQLALKEEEGKLQLSIEDDGRGFDASQVRPDSVGYKIIIAMVNQLQGRLEIINKGGAKISMEFQYR